MEVLFQVIFSPNRGLKAQVPTRSICNLRSVFVVNKMKGGWEGNEKSVQNIVVLEITYYLKASATLLKNT